MLYTGWRGIGGGITTSSNLAVEVVCKVPSGEIVSADCGGRCRSLTCFTTWWPENGNYVLAELLLLAFRTTSRSLDSSTLAVKPVGRQKTLNALNFIWSMLIKDWPKYCSSRTAVMLSCIAVTSTNCCRSSTTPNAVILKERQQRTTL